MLAPLSEEELTRILDAAELVQAQMKEHVYERGNRIRHVHFPLTAVFSMVALVDEERVIEVATIGNEGMVGLPLFLGALKTPNDAFCQISGESIQVSAEALEELLPKLGRLHSQLRRFTQATLIQLSQNVACNQAHSVRQRAARWLLMTHDRVGGDRFPLTHEFLGQMLGVRRATVSETAAGLQDDGLISYRRGVMNIQDREGLEKVACSCYRIVRTEFDQLNQV